MPPPIAATDEAVEAKKLAMSKEWLEDAYKGEEYGHDGACAVCYLGWSRTAGPKEDDIFPIDGQRAVSKLFHLKCLEKEQLRFSNTWRIYQHWKLTGEIVA